MPRPEPCTARNLLELFEPLSIGLFLAPRIAFLPLFLLIFGIDIMQKVMFGAFHGFFVVALNMIGGLRQGDRDLVLLGRSMGASNFPAYSSSSWPCRRRVSDSCLTGPVTSETWPSCLRSSSWSQPWQWSSTSFLASMSGA